jgi:signal transduction histidine kinase
VIAAVEPLDEAAPSLEQVAGARMAAHDLNNLLAVIIGHAELAIAGLPAEAQIRPSLEEIQSAAERSARLVRRILTPPSVSQPVAKAVDVNRVILGLRDIAKFLVDSNIRIVLELDQARPRAWADEEGMTLALANIVKNAGEAMPKGGTLTIRTRSDDLVSIAVTDTGAGMTSEILGRLSKPGFTTKPGGHGIGLFSAREFAGGHSGRIDIASELGKGTTVTLWLRPAPSPGSN